MTLRWLVLHRVAQHRKVRESVTRATSAEDVLKLMLGTAQLEFVLKEMFKTSGCLPPPMCHVSSMVWFKECYWSTTIAE